MTRGLVDLPIEVLRRTIQYLLYNPTEPTRFRKSNLLPLASTCRHLRDASIEFLFWSVDLFEASFGLQHRVLKSNVALERFHNIIAYPVGYLRGGVRRFLVRDRDRTASIDLWHLLEKFESLRSLHLDGPFGPETFPSAPQSLLEHTESIRLYITLVNLTFIGCKSSSPLFPFFLRSGIFINLTRLDYQDDGGGFDDSKIPNLESQTVPSPFERLASETKPVFPYLSTVVIKVSRSSKERLCHILHFLEVHSGSLQRLSAYLGPEISWYISLDFLYTGNEIIQEFTALLWKTVERLTNLRVLCMDVSCARKGCAPESVIHLTHLQGIYVHTNSSFISIDRTKRHEAHPITEFLDKFQVPHVAFGQDLTYVLQVDPSLRVRQLEKATAPYRRALKWFRRTHLRFAQSLTHIDTETGRMVLYILPGGGREIREATPAKQEEILEVVGGWSFEEYEM